MIPPGQDRGKLIAARPPGGKEIEGSPAVSVLQHAGAELPEPLTPGTVACPRQEDLHDEDVVIGSLGGVVAAAPKARCEGGRGVEPAKPATDPTARGPPREVWPVGVAGPPQVPKAESGGETAEVRQAPGLAGGDDPTLPVKGHVLHHVEVPPPQR